METKHEQECSVVFGSHGFVRKEADEIFEVLVKSKMTVSESRQLLQTVSDLLPSVSRVGGLELDKLSEESTKES